MSRPTRSSEKKNPVTTRSLSVASIPGLAELVEITVALKKIDGS